MASSKQLFNNNNNYIYFFFIMLISDEYSVSADTTSSGIGIGKEKMLSEHL